MGWASSLSQEMHENVISTIQSVPAIERAVNNLNCGWQDDFILDMYMNPKLEADSLMEVLCTSDVWFIRVLRCTGDFEVSFSTIPTE